MKQLSEQQVDDLLKLKFGNVVEESGHCAFVSNKILGKVFKISEHSVAYLLRVRFERHRLNNMPFKSKLQQPEKSQIPF